MKAEELIDRINRAAACEYAAGRRSRDIFAEADEMDRTGFTASAPFHRLLAQTVKELEDRHA